MSTFARSLPVTCVCALAVVDVGCLILRPTLSVAIVAGIGALVFTLLAAGLAALIRTPSFSETARVLDRRARLDDRAVTALQFAAVTDAVSRLIVEETTARLETTPVSVLPLDVSAPWRWSAVAVLALSGVIVVSLDRLDAGSSSMRASGPSSAATSAQAGRANARQGSLSSAQGDARKAAGPEHPDPAPTPLVQRTNRGENSSELGAARAGVGSTARQPGSAPGDKDHVDPARSAAAQRTEAVATASRTSDADRAGGGDASRAARAALSAAGRGARGATRGGAAGGGVAGGALARDGAAPTVSMSPANNGLPADFRRAYARAEAAIAGERVPPRLRSYVRDYFLAIRPQPTP